MLVIIVSSLSAYIVLKLKALPLPDQVKL